MEDKTGAARPRVSEVRDGAGPVRSVLSGRGQSNQSSTSNLKGGWAAGFQFWARW